MKTVLIALVRFYRLMLSPRSGAATSPCNGLAVAIPGAKVAMTRFQALLFFHH